MGHDHLFRSYVGDFGIDRSRGFVIAITVYVVVLEKIAVAKHVFHSPVRQRRMDSRVS